MKVARYEALGALADELWIELSGFFENSDGLLVDRYHPSSNAIGTFTDENGTYSWCRPLPIDIYDKIIFIHGSKLLNTAWTRTWIVAAINALKEGGHIILPYRKDKIAEVGGMSPGEIHSLLGKPVIIENGYAAFCPVKGEAYHESILAWFLSFSNSAIAWLTEYLAAEKRTDMSAKKWKKGLNCSYGDTDLFWLIEDMADTENLCADFIKEKFVDLTRYLVFSVQGVNGKSFALNNIFDDLWESKQNIRWADLGSGSGLLGIELSLKRGSMQVFNYDKSLAQSRIGIDIMKDIGLLRSGCCKMITSRLENVTLPVGLDAVTMLTSLCYVSKKDQPSVLLNAWNSLSSGGVLMVYENIKSKKYSRDYNLMFEEKELDDLLGTLGGKLHYRHSLTGKIMDPKTVQGKTCYRVVTKP